MLTAAQVATAAYMTRDGALYRDLDDVPEDDDGFRLPVRDVSVYELDEMASEAAYGYEWPDEDEDDWYQDKHAECQPGLFDENGYELVEEYHYHPEKGVNHG